MPFSREQIDRALLQLALLGDDVGAAARALERGGLKVDRKTLVRWRDEDHPERFIEIQTRALPLIEEAITHDALMIAKAAAEVTLDLVETTRERNAAGEIKNPSGAAKDMSFVGGIWTDKGQLLQGKPTTTVSHRSVQEAMEELRIIAPGMVVDSTAVDVTPRELPPGETVTSAPDVTVSRPDVTVSSPAVEPDVTLVTPSVRVCMDCGKPMIGRSQAKTCSAKCRKALSRR